LARSSSITPSGLFLTLPRALTQPVVFLKKLHAPRPIPRFKRSERFPEHLHAASKTRFELLADASADLRFGKLLALAFEDLPELAHHRLQIGGALELLPQDSHPFPMIAHFPSPSPLSQEPFILPEKLDAAGPVFALQTLEGIFEDLELRVNTPGDFRPEATTAGFRPPQMGGFDLDRLLDLSDRRPKVRRTFDIGVERRDPLSVQHRHGMIPLYS